MISLAPLSVLPDCFNTPEVRALIQDLDLVPLCATLRSEYLWPYIPCYVHQPDTVKKGFSGKW